MINIRVKMPISDIYSKRKKRLQGESPEIYSYDTLNRNLRVQIVQIWSSVIEEFSRDFYEQRFIIDSCNEIVKKLCTEYGVFNLLDLLSKPQITPEYSDDALRLFFLEVEDVEKALSVVEFIFQVVDNQIRNHHSTLAYMNPTTIDAAIEELNYRFREDGVGYQYESGKIIPITSEFIHSEVVKPALGLLNQRRFAGAQEEFLKAHEHYRNRDTKEALYFCLKAFESVVKAISDKRGWIYDERSTAKDLIQICFDKGLIPNFWQSHYSSLRSLLESGVPTGRNKLSGHGQGSKPITVPDHLAAYMIHMTASAIVFLAESENKLP